MGNGRGFKHTPRGDGGAGARRSSGFRPIPLSLGTVGLQHRLAHGTQTPTLTPAAVRKSRANPGPSLSHGRALPASAKRNGAHPYQTIESKTATIGTAITADMLRAAFGVRLGLSRTSRF